MTAVLLRNFRFKLRKEGVSFRAKDERFNFVIPGDKWFDNRAGVGGVGAIDLQMHLRGWDFRAACRVLSERFPQASECSRGGTPRDSSRGPNASSKNYTAFISTIPVIAEKILRFFLEARSSLRLEAPVFSR